MVLKSVFSRILLLFIALVLLGLPFQNCSQVNFSLLQTLSSPDKIASSDNGTFFDGKPDGHYYRIRPDFTCENKVAPVAALDFVSGQVTFTENRILLCAAEVNNLDPKLVDVSVYQDYVIGHQEGIFEEFSSAPTSIPANLVEVWCRDRDDKQGIETITYYDRLQQKAVNRIYHATQGSDGSYVFSQL